MRYLKHSFLLFLLLIISSNFTFATYESNWLNPKPFGNNFFTIEQIDDNTLLLAGSGIIVKTTDLGTTWHKKNYFKNINIYEIQKISSTNVVAVAYDLATERVTIFKSDDAGDNWEQSPTDFEDDVYSLFFHNSDDGILVGEDGFIAKTDDGGATWTEITSGVDTRLNKVLFADENVGYAFGGTWEQSVVLKTTNGGDTWSNISPDAQRPLETAAVINENLIFAAGELGFIIKSTDGGQNWTEFNHPDMWAFYSMSFLNANFGVCVGEMGFILLTTDGGTTWEDYLSDTDAYLNDVKILDEDLIFVVGESGTMLLSEDSGENFDLLSEGFNNWFYDITKAPNGDLYIVGFDGVIIKSTNNGDDWEQVRINNGDFEILNSITFPGNSIGYAVGFNAQIIKTDDGGQSWTAQDTDVDVSLNDVYFFDEDMGLIVGSNGTLLSTSNGGTTWVLKSIGTIESMTALTFVDESKGFVTGSKQVWMSTNGGETWSKKLEDNNLNAVDIFFLNANTGWVLNQYGNIYRTADGGQNWEQFDITADIEFYSLEFLNEHTGYVSGSAGTIYKTKNGGMSWELVGSNINSSNLHSILFLNNNTAVLAGASGTVIDFNRTGLDSPALLAPANNALDLPFPIELSWYPLLGADEYNLQIASDELFTKILLSVNTTDTEYEVQTLSPRANYFWRVKAINDTQESEYSEIRTFKSEIQVVEFNINLSSGWNQISLNVVPEELNIADIVAEIEDNVVIVKQGSGIYIPGTLNSINDINLTLGFSIFVSQAETLEVIAMPADPAEWAIDLKSGWQMIAYLLQEPKPIVDVFADIVDKIVIVKSGSGVYIPGTLNTIGNMLPGKAYSIFLSSPVEFYYEE